MCGTVQPEATVAAWERNAIRVRVGHPDQRAHVVARHVRTQQVIRPTAPSVEAPQRCAPPRAEITPERAATGDGIRHTMNTTILHPHFRTPQQAVVVRADDVRRCRRGGGTRPTHRERAADVAENVREQRWVDGAQNGRVRARISGQHELQEGPDESAVVDGDTAEDAIVAILDLPHRVLQPLSHRRFDVVGGWLRFRLR